MKTLYIACALHSTIHTHSHTDGGGSHAPSCSLGVQSLAQGLSDTNPTQPLSHRCHAKYFMWTLVENLRKDNVIALHYSSYANVANQKEQIYKFTTYHLCDTLSARYSARMEHDKQRRKEHAIFHCLSASGNWKMILTAKNQLLP